MLKILPEHPQQLLKAALGELACDIVFTNAKIVNVFTGEVLNGDVYVYEGFIAHVEYEHPGVIDVPVNETIDCEGMYLIPGLIDAHMHIESTMLTPRNFAKAVLPKGTTTVVTDPHEIANVFGVPGVKYMHETSSDLPMRQLIDIPSCVPSVPGKECTGAVFTAKDIETLSSLERVVGLAEIMDFPGVIHGDQRMMSEIAAARAHGLYLQGHAPMVSGRMLSAYLCGGPETDHESGSAAEALEKYRLGMHIDMRESTMAKNVKEIWSGLKGSRYFDTLDVCTDDRESGDLLKYGHINDVLRIAIREGMNPIDAIKSATINNAREIHLDHLGAIAPGYAADLCVLPDLNAMNMYQVYYGGKLVAKDDKLMVKIEDRTDPIEEIDSMNIPDLTAEDFVLKAPIQNGTVRVNVIDYPSLSSAYTKRVEMNLEVKDGKVLLPDENTKFAAIVNRFGLDHIALAVVRGVGNTTGALASTVSHDSHNLTIVYDTPEDALLCAETLKNCRGGLVTVKDGKVLAVLPLPIGGLLSKLDAEHTSELAEQVKEADRKIGLTGIGNPLLRIATLALPVCPELKMSDLGMIDSAAQQFVPVFPD
ncbi:MAG: adenine deaminase [Solobacterium sp.]|nr:adenine deaminase [Solobacterium sp.]